MVWQWTDCISHGTAVDWLPEARHGNFMFHTNLLEIESINSREAVTAVKK
jgi:hypothetical protein